MSAHRFIINGLAASYQTVLAVVSTMGPARGVYYTIKSASSPPEAEIIIIILWSGDVIEANLQEQTAVRPHVSTLLSDFPMAVVGYVSGIVV